MDIRKSDFALRVHNRVGSINDSKERRRNTKTEIKFKPAFNYNECSDEMDHLKRKYGVDFHNLPFDIVGLFVKIFTQYLELTNERLDNFREKILELRRQDL